MNDNNEKGLIQEDEIDLRELFFNIWEHKLFIFIFTTIITTFSIVYAYTKTPIYEVTSNVQVGFIGEELITNPEVLQKKTEAYFQAMDSKQNSIEFVSKVTEISQPKTVKDFITIKTEAHSNDNAMERNKEVVKYIQDLNNQKIQQYMSDIKYQIINTKKGIENLNNFEKVNILNEINKIKTQEIKQIDEEIERLKTQDIAKLNEEIEKIKQQDLKKIDEKINLLITQDIAKLNEEIEKIKQQDLKKIDEKINLLKTQDVPRIENQIKFLLENKIQQIDSKISFNQENLIKYNENVKKIYSETKNTDNTTLLTVSSLQMTNYQNLILNAQNKIEDLKLEKKTIIEETIPELKLKKENILNITINDLEIQKENTINFKLKNLKTNIDNINNIEIVNLKREKENIINFKLKNLNNQIDNINDMTITNLERNKLNISSDKIRKLEYKYNVDLPSKELKLKEKIRQLEFKISDENIQNSVVLGDYLLSDYPTKPKKKLIVVVGFTTALIVSIFLSLLISFVRNKN